MAKVIVTLNFAEPPEGNHVTTDSMIQSALENRIGKINGVEMYSAHVHPEHSVVVPAISFWSGAIALSCLIIGWVHYTFFPA